MPICDEKVRSFQGSSTAAVIEHLNTRSISGAKTPIFTCHMCRHQHPRWLAAAVGRALGVSGTKGGLMVVGEQMSAQYLAPRRTGGHTGVWQ